MTSLSSETFNDDLKLSLPVKPPPLVKFKRELPRDIKMTTSYINYINKENVHTRESGVTPSNKTLYKKKLVESQNRIK